MISASSPEATELVGTPDDWREALEKVEALTPRRRQVLALMAQGLITKEIARTLGISPRTVEIHRHELMNDIGAKTSADAVRIAIHAELAGKAP